MNVQGVLLLVLGLWSHASHQAIQPISDLQHDSSAEEDYVQHRFKRKAFEPYKTGKELAREMTQTLDELLGPRYDKRVRPGFGKKKLHIVLNMSIRSMGPVDENTQSFFLDCYFRQTWKDDRLAFNNSGISELSLDWKILKMIWKPDTFFINGKKSKMHKMTVPNRFSRISPDGSVSFSQRLTIHATCKMGLKKFPFDSQICPLYIGSYGYPAEEVTYSWKPQPISLEEVSMAQFSLVGWDYGTSTNRTNRKIESGFRTDSIAFLLFSFERQSGYFILQIYTPLLLIVFCSWVAFWIIKTDVPARCGLGVTTVLSVTKIGFAPKGKPEVPYATALDVFVMVCFICVFASLIEFAVINFITLYIRRYKEAEERAKELKEKKSKEFGALEKQLLEEYRKSRARRRSYCPICDGPFGQPPLADKENGQGGGSEEDKHSEHDDDNGTEKQDAVPIPTRVSTPSTNEDRRRRKKKKDLPPWLQRLQDRMKVPRIFVKLEHAALLGVTRLISFLTMKPIHQMMIYHSTEEALEWIDAKSRIFFPTVFGFLMLVYWSTYLYIMDDKKFF
ncbi:hypothetical protein TCAL_06418 [Tigriopus californicus]|uniref:Gamma-aminobutyric acid receptor subunit beta n=1 Tax=Tigriopus californicus TaxID=6832 RepID=A0A553PAB4_TIGCA|nr:gamma-aminobutyric acid receptor subunit alpha-6-like [Tigriopus californicus]TRY74627.1 hypothetical protein TCAL_06418 [Tigriopus californicus]